MNPLSKAFNVVRCLGPGFVTRRLSLALQSRLGFTRRAFAPRPWETIALGDILSPGTPTDPVEYAAFKRAGTPLFLFPLGSPPTIPPDLAHPCPGRSPGLSERLDLLRGDRCIYFFHQTSPEPIDWYHNPFDDTHGDNERTWCDIPDFLPSQGDARVLWEPSRAAWAFDLARAAGRGTPFPVAEVFWKWVDSWMTACPPFVGFQWKCGQESTVRFIAIAFGFWATAGDSDPAPRRWLQFVRLAWATAYRIAKHIRYAISQNNNHSLSEACGLLLIAQLFPELRDAQMWMNLGRSVLASGLRQQVDSDGSYVQHSMNYHRVMLHVSILALRLGELAARPFDRDLYDRIGRAAAFLFQMTDETTGRTPNYGNNDGACVLPLAECDFHDFRPVVQSAHYLVHRQRLLTPGPWDEELLWLFGEEALRPSPRAAILHESTAFADGGYFTLRRKHSWAMIRCHHYRKRPGQYDPLHVDLWWNGTNVLGDRGTYRYYSPRSPSLEAYFRTPSAHNTVELDGGAPVQWISRFLFVPFPRARRVMNADRLDPKIRHFEGASYDYARRPWRVVHHRTVLGLSEDLWVIVDDLVGGGAHDGVLRWQLPSLPFELFGEKQCLSLQTDAGPATISVMASPHRNLEFRVAVGRIERERAAGFSAPYYNSLVPAPTLEVSFRSHLPQRLLTTVHLGCRGETIRKGDARNLETWQIRNGARVWSLTLKARVPKHGLVFVGAQQTSGDFVPAP